jgi:hypothetical protein
MAFSVNCDRCLRKFANLKRLNKHRLERHGTSSVVNPRFFYGNGVEAVNPLTEFMEEDVKEQQYFEWLSCVTERINGAHHPGFKGQFFN